MNLKDTDELLKLIDDDIAAHKDGYFEDFELPPTAYGSLCALRMVREYIKALPTVEAEPVKHGHWIFGNTKGHSWMKCSECCVSQSGQTATFTYCPNCGAKVDEQQEAE